MAEATTVLFVFTAKFVAKMKHCPGTFKVLKYVAFRYKNQMPLFIWVHIKDNLLGF